MHSEVTFKKAGAGQFVYLDGVLSGAVRKVEDWTVRGNRTRWEASRKGRVIGWAETRKEAAALLAPSAQNSRR